MLEYCKETDQEPYRQLKESCEHRGGKGVELCLAETHAVHGKSIRFEHGFMGRLMQLASKYNDTAPATANTFYDSVALATNQPVEYIKAALLVVRAPDVIHLHKNAEKHGMHNNRQKYNLSMEPCLLFY